MAFLTRVLRSSPSSGGEPLHDDPVGVIDTALCLARRRQFFTSEEACELLVGVQNKVRGEALGAGWAELIAAAEESFGEGMLVERSRLLDTLLDLRLLATR